MIRAGIEGKLTGSASWLAITGSLLFWVWMDQCMFGSALDDVADISASQFMTLWMLAGSIVGVIAAAVWVRDVARLWHGGALGLVAAIGVIGAVLCAFARGADVTVLYYLGGILVGASMGYFIVPWGVVAVAQGIEKALLHVSGAWGLGLFVNLALDVVPDDAKWIFGCLLPLGSLALFWALHAAQDSPVYRLPLDDDRALVSVGPPSPSIKVSGRTFMGIDLQFMLVVLVTCTIFGVMSQYKTPFPPSFIFGGMDASLSRGVASAVFFAACLLLPFEKLSALFRVAISLVAMGAIVLTVALFEGQLEVPGRVLVSLGYAGFDILIWCLIAFFAQRSRNITVSVAAAMGVEQVGILLGAIIVLLLQNTGIGPLAFSIVLMVLTYALLLACFALLGRYLKGWPTFSLPRESSASHGDGAKDAVEELAHVCGLTPREKDVALLLCEGRSAPYIAEKLFVSENTVKTHVRHIYEKGDFHNRQEFLDAMKAKRMQK